MICRSKPVAGLLHITHKDFLSLTTACTLGEGGRGQECNCHFVLSFVLLKEVLSGERVKAKSCSKGGPDSLPSQRWQKTIDAPEKESRICCQSAEKEVRLGCLLLPDSRFAEDSNNQRQRTFSFVDALSCPLRLPQHNKRHGFSKNTFCDYSLFYLFHYYWHDERIDRKTGERQGHRYSGNETGTR